MGDKPLASSCKDQLDEVELQRPVCDFWELGHGCRWNEVGHLMPKLSLLTMASTIIDPLDQEEDTMGCLLPDGWFSPDAKSLQNQHMP